VDDAALQLLGALLGDAPDLLDARLVELVVAALVEAEARYRAAQKLKGKRG